jgi:hypothetical protein
MKPIIKTKIKIIILKAVEILLNSSNKIYRLVMMVLDIIHRPVFYLKLNSTL